MFYYGLLTGVVFFLLLLSASYIGFKLGKKKKYINTIDDVEKQRQKRLREQFLNMMNYDLDTAYGRKKVR